MQLVAWRPLTFSCVSSFLCFFRLVVGQGVALAPLPRARRWAEIRAKGTTPHSNHSADFPPWLRLMVVSFGEFTSRDSPEASRVRRVRRRWAGSKRAREESGTGWAWV